MCLAKFNNPRKTAPIAERQFMKAMDGIDIRTDQFANPVVTQIRDTPEKCFEYHVRCPHCGREHNNWREIEQCQRGGGR